MTRGGGLPRNRDGCEPDLRLALNGATVPTVDLETGVQIAYEEGFVGYEPRVPALHDAEARGVRDRVLGHLRAAGMTWLPLNGLEGVFELEPERLAVRTREVFSLAARFSVPQVIVVPGQPDCPISLEAARATLCRLAEAAGDYGISLLYELIGFSSHAFPSLRAAVGLTAGLGIPLVLDTFHLAVSGTDASAIRALDARSIGLVHLSDALVRGAMEELTDAERVLPGEDGGLPVVELLGGVLDAGYRGWVSVEVFHPRYGMANPSSTARRAYRSAREAIVAARERFGDRPRQGEEAA
jgi:sugar phosphate isomerase/epimerase